MKEYIASDVRLTSNNVMTRNMTVTGQQVEYDSTLTVPVVMT